MTVANTILWNNSSPLGPEIAILKNSATLNISYTDVKGGQPSVSVDPGCTLHWGSGMIQSDPSFVDAANGDYHLAFHSSCKDVGDGTLPGLEDWDYEGDPRRLNGSTEVDIGADEFHPHLYWGGNATPGGALTLTFVGAPGTSGLGLVIGTDIIDPPFNSAYGDLHIKPPWSIFLGLGNIPVDGVFAFPAVVPPSPTAPYTVMIQALIGSQLSNLSVLQVD